MPLNSVVVVPNHLSSHPVGLRKVSSGCPGRRVIASGSNLQGAGADIGSFHKSGILFMGP